jgi:hypothetical protein
MIRTVETGDRTRSPRARRARRTALAAAAAASLAVTTPMFAGQAKNWTGGTGTWDTFGAWTPNGQPAQTDSVFINQPGASVTYINPIDPDAIYSDLQINGTIASPATLTHAQSLTLNANRMLIGNVGNGALNQSGGAVSVLEAEGLSLGQEVTGNGTYTLGGSGVLTVANQVLVGELGTGTFMQSGGRLIVNGSAPASGVLSVAGFAGSTGTYNLSAGSLEVGSLQLAMIGGNATVNHSGGSVAPLTDVSVGDPTLPGMIGQSLYNHTGGGVTAPQLNIGSTGRFRQAGGTLRVNQLTIDLTGGKLDLVDQNMVYDYSGGSPLATVKNYVATAYAGGAWTGNGITTTAASPNRAVAFAEASDLLSLTGTNKATWNGQQVDATSILLRYTLTGDANMDGAVDFNDLVRLAQNYNVADGQRRWTQADFTYDGNVDFNDLVALAQSYNSVLPAAPIPGASAQFTADLATAFASVPEPGVAAVAAAGALAAVGTRGRRRRRHAKRAASGPDA